MKRFIATLFLIVFSCTSAMANEIAYYNKTWDEIKAKAKAEHKYIFVDCYTSWCGWCKVMDKETMQDDGIVALMGNKYVAVKMDMEKGEGIKLAMKFHITGYPTFLFFNADGNFIYEAVGYQKTDKFTQVLNDALDETKQFKAPGYSTSLDVDLPLFYQDAYGANGAKKSPTGPDVYAYLGSQKDPFTEANWAVLARFDLNDAYTQYFLDNITKYEQLYSTYCVQQKVNAVLSARLQAVMKDKDTAKFRDILNMVDKYVKDDPRGVKINVRSTFYKETKDWGKYTEAISDYIAINGYANEQYIHSLCAAMCQECNDKKLLNKICPYMLKVVNKDDKYAYLDTYATLLYKTGQVKEAKTWANKAIAIGKKTGADISSAEALLKKD